jgi:hypothetical protein
MSKTIYVSTLIAGNCGWGDGVPVLWLSEYLHKIKGYEVYLYGAGNSNTAITYLDLATLIRRKFIIRSQAKKEKTSLNKIGNLKKFKILKDKCKGKPFFHENYIEKPDYIYSFLQKKPYYKEFDYVLVTHSMHAESDRSWASGIPRDKSILGIYPPTARFFKSDKNFVFLNFNSSIVNLIYKKNFIPTFPLLKNTKLNDNLKIESPYITIQFRRSDEGELNTNLGHRNLHTNKSFDKWALEFLFKCSQKWGLTIFVTSDYSADFNSVNRVVDASSLDLWNKIDLHRKAKFSYVAHSGFGMIVSGYRGFKDTNVINCAYDAIYRNPPLILFSNISEKDKDTIYTESNPGWIDQYNNYIVDKVANENP